MALAVKEKHEEILVFFTEVSEMTACFVPPFILITCISLLVSTKCSSHGRHVAQSFTNSSATGIYM